MYEILISVHSYKKILNTNFATWKNNGMKIQAICAKIYWWYLDVWYFLIILSNLYQQFNDISNLLTQSNKSRRCIRQFIFLRYALWFLYSLSKVSHIFMSVSINKFSELYLKKKNFCFNFWINIGHEYTQIWFFFRFIH